MAGLRAEVSSLVALGSAPAAPSGAARTSAVPSATSPTVAAVPAAPTSSVAATVTASAAVSVAASSAAVPFTALRAVLRGGSTLGREDSVTARGIGAPAEARGSIAAVTSTAEASAAASTPVVPTLALLTAVFAAVPLPSATIFVAFGRGSLLLAHLGLYGRGHPQGPI